MKQLFLSLAIICCLFSCSKEKVIEPISGTWTIIETNTDIGGGIQVQNYAPSSELTLQFGPDGHLILTGANPGLAMSPLWEYDRFEVLPHQVIRFFQSSGNGEMQAYVTINGELFLNYLTLRCGYEERFLRVK